MAEGALSCQEMACGHCPAAKGLGNVQVHSQGDRLIDACFAGSVHAANPCPSPPRTPSIIYPSTRCYMKRLMN
eukprot:111758-Chlamydomonas_euryale.AAC.2